jgi:hypothetical protein
MPHPEACTTPPEDDMACPGGYTTSPEHDLVCAGGCLRDAGGDLQRAVHDRALAGERYRRAIHYLIAAQRRNSYQSEYFVPSSAVASAPLLTSYTPGGAFGLLGSGSLGTVCHDVAFIVNGSSGIFRR